MTNTPLVSIIIPTFNRAHLIGETLESVLSQTYTNWECIVVDDGSTDHSEEVIGGYVKTNPKIQYHKRPENTIKGASSCRNHGLYKATGLYVIFLDSDDVLLPNCVTNRILKIKETSENYFWVFPMAIQNNGKSRVQTIPKRNDYLKAFLSCKIHWGIMCTIWEIEFLKTIGGFNPQYPRLNDPEIHVRAMLSANSNYRVFYNAPHDSVYKEATIKNKNAYALNYFMALQMFIPDMCKLLIANKKRTQKVLLKAYLNHYIKDFEKYTPWKNMLVLLNTFYKNRVIFLTDYCYRMGKYLLLKLFTVILKKLKVSNTG
ncbi:glycosyltransferase family 2 protein [Mariniflexile sp. HNIBRBA6329]|uniref:glycosyltransferase family 2 protein n=1 Tax=Mariniflexile sp. HNIBRBA6329 TaxID=3373088 RepID=UPI0037469AE8